MRKLKYYLDQCADVFISVKGEDKLLIGKNEMMDFVSRVYGAGFVTTTTSHSHSMVTTWMNA